jgi:class 3 adenylate cyclase
LRYTLVRGVAAEAGPGEVLVSRTVKDLVAGSGLRFEDRGIHEPKGVQESWQLHAVAIDLETHGSVASSSSRDTSAA